MIGDSQDAEPGRSADISLNSPLIAVVGPTATGKSELALNLAERLGNSVILNADSMQLYRGLDVGTAKTPLGERRGIPHLLFDQLDVDQEASVARYQTVAQQQVRTEQAQGRAVVAVGGSGLYVRALIDRMEFPGTDSQVRAKWENLAATEGRAHLHQLLKRRDPVAAAQIHPNNARRVIRALEVIEVTGRPFSANLPSQEYVFRPTFQFGLAWDLAELDARIDARAASMFAGGLIEETRALLGRGRQFGKTAAGAIGYAQAIAVAEGSMSVGQAIDQVALETRQLARRQVKWFRRDSRIVWLDPHSDPAAAAWAILETGIQS